jgi:hypothetical protein
MLTGVLAVPQPLKNSSISIGAVDFFYKWCGTYREGMWCSPSPEGQNLDDYQPSLDVSCKMCEIAPVAGKSEPCGKLARPNPLHPCRQTWKILLLLTGISHPPGNSQHDLLLTAEET